jgi:hypothetical protein
VKQVLATIIFFEAEALALKETAPFVRFGGGYWDSGFIPPLDFFGDSPRIPVS